MSCDPPSPASHERGDNFFLIQSSSTLSCPICLWSSSRSSFHCRSVFSLFLEKASGTMARADFFQRLTRDDGTSYSLAISAAVLVPLMASMATRVLSAGSYFFRMDEFQLLFVHPSRLIVPLVYLLTWCPVFGDHYNTPCD